MSTAAPAASFRPSTELESSLGHHGQRPPAEAVSHVCYNGACNMSAGAVGKLRAGLAQVDPDQGWFFAQVAQQVAEQRKAHGLSQQELAGLTGTTQSAIARLVSGGRPPRIDTLLRIAEALDCELVVELRRR
jgi:DNA-binding phage protein